MEVRRLTGTGLMVSRLCLGSMTFGSQVDERGSVDLIRRAADAGINFFDTADCYNGGESERICGEALNPFRDRVILASKVGNPAGPEPDKGGLGRRRILEQVERSLRRLQTDYLDLYYLHRPDPNTPIEETLEAMNRLVESGKVRCVGVSNYAAWQIVECLWRADRGGFAAPVVTQNIYNLLTRNIERELLPCLKAQGMGLTVYSPLASGMLSGKYSPGKAPEANSRFASNLKHRDRFWKDYNFKAVEELSEIAREAGLTLPELATRWCVGHDAVDSVIIGVSRPSQLEDTIRAAERGALPTEVLERCDAVWSELDDKSFAYHR